MEIKKTLLMPKTNFEMRGNLPNKEPAIRESWQTNKSALKSVPSFLRRDTYDFSFMSAKVVPDTASFI